MMVLTYFFSKLGHEMKKIPWQAFESDNINKSSAGGKENGWEKGDESRAYLFKEHKITATIFWKVCNALKIKILFSH